MNRAALILTALVLLEHLYIVVLEMVFWKKRAHLTFPITRKFAGETAAMASNQGLYNGFLAAALALGLFLPDAALAHAFRLYGLVCVAVAGAWGGFSVTPRIFLVQSLPALLTLLLMWLGHA